MNVYHFHPETREFLGVDTADPSPMEPGKFLVPANATTVEPPVLQERQAAVAKNDGQWEIVDDFRDTEYWLPEDQYLDSPRVIRELGLPLPENALTEPPTPTALEQREMERQALKQQRDLALQAITHEWPDGTIVQVRPQDRDNLREAIENGTPLLWVLADNTSRETTPEELQAALDAGTDQAKAIWATYAARLNELNAV